MGFYLLDADEGSVVGQFPHLYPVWIAIGYGVNGLTWAGPSTSGAIGDTLEPHGWLTQAQVDRKRAEVPEQTWLSEYDLQEPSAEGRAIDSKAVDWTFDPQPGDYGITL